MLSQISSPLVKSGDTDHTADHSRLHCVDTWLSCKNFPENQEFISVAKVQKCWNHLSNQNCYQKELRTERIQDVFITPSDTHTWLKKINEWAHHAEFQIVCLVNGAPSEMQYNPSLKYKLWVTSFQRGQNGKWGEIDMHCMESRGKSNFVMGSPGEHDLEVIYICTPGRMEWKSKFTSVLFSSETYNPSLIMRKTSDKSQ